MEGRKEVEVEEKEFHFLFARPSPLSFSFMSSSPVLSHSSVGVLLAGTLDHARVKDCEHSLAHLRNTQGFYTLILVQTPLPFISSHVAHGDGWLLSAGSSCELAS